MVMYMAENRKELEKMDYMEPECVLCDRPVGFKQKKQMIPQQRISQKVDELMARNEFTEVERMFKYWLEEAKVNYDEQGEFMLYNEMMGFYRKTGRKEEGYAVVDKAMSMLNELGYRDSVSGATCYTNAATVYTSFKDYERSLLLFEKAKVIYENNVKNNEYKLASLYNNMALALVGLKRFEEAKDLYNKAIETVKNCENGELEIAMTYLNMLDALISEKGICEEIDEKATMLLYQAQCMLDTESLPRDDYYAYVLDKCVSIYEFFGWNGYAKELRERIREINERA